VTKEEAVTEVIDEILGRHHGIITGQRHGADFLDWLRERGYTVVKIRAGDLEAR
jgi:hypothetical protein